MRPLAAIRSDLDAVRSAMADAFAARFGTQRSLKHLLCTEELVDRELALEAELTEAALAPGALRCETCDGQGSIPDPRVPDDLPGVTYPCPDGCDGGLLLCTVPSCASYAETRDVDGEPVCTVCASSCWTCRHRVDAEHACPLCDRRALPAAA